MKSSQIFAVVMLSIANQAIANNSSNLLTTTDFGRSEKGEGLPGGTATYTKKANKNAFSHPSANMSFEREMDFRIGNGFFKRLWVSAPASTQAADGLGPLFNARACQRCHLRDGRGHPPSGKDDNAVSMFLRLSIPPQDDADKKRLANHQVNVIPEPTYGTQLQDFAIQGHAAEGKMNVAYKEIFVELSGGEVVVLRKPTYSISGLAYGPLHPKTMISPRVAPPMIGLGLLEAIDPLDIEQQADPGDQDGDGISGKVNQVWSQLHNQVMPGRFGWKAGAANVDEQSQGAFAGDMGLSVPLHRAGAGECTANQKHCVNAPDGNSPQFDNLEVPQLVSDLVTFYSRNLAVPARRDYRNPEVLKGKESFYRVGCISCHTPKYRTQVKTLGPEQSNQLIWPYSDLLLHNMGDGLADHRPEGVADGYEWRTAPLWGVGLTPLVNGHSNYLHDGRARSVIEAILWHGGEAQSQRDKVVQLPKEERDRLVRFVESL